MAIYVMTPSHANEVESSKVKYTTEQGVNTNVSAALDDLYKSKNPVYFGTYLEFPNIGSEDILYIDKETTFMYLWDTTTATYVKQVSDVQNYIFQSTL